MPTLSAPSVIKTKGFTIIELLVTISIIAVLSAIGMVAYTTVLKQGRDAKRQADLRTIQSALEQYYADQGFYPCARPLCSGLDARLQSAISSSVSFTNEIGNPNTVNPSEVKTYINTLPKETGSQPRYCYKAYDNQTANYMCNNTTGAGLGICNAYKLYADLENQPPGSFACGGNTYNFEILPP